MADEVTDPLSVDAAKPEHVCTRACFRTREMFSLPFSWCSRFSFGEPEHKNWRRIDLEFKVSEAQWTAMREQDLVS